MRLCLAQGFGLARYRWPTLVGDIANALHQLDQLVPAVQPEGQPEAADEPRPPTVVQVGGTGVEQWGVSHCGSPPHCHCLTLHLVAPPTDKQADVAFLCSSGVMPALLTCLHWMAAEPWVTHRLDTARPGQPALQHRLLAFLCGAARQGGGVGAALLESGVEEVVEAVRRGAPVRASCVWVRPRWVGGWSGGCWWQLAQLLALTARLPPLSIATAVWRAGVGAATG